MRPQPLAEALQRTEAQRKESVSQGAYLLSLTEALGSATVKKDYSKFAKEHMLSPILHPPREFAGVPELAKLNVRKSHRLLVCWEMSLFNRLPPDGQVTL